MKKYIISACVVLPFCFFAKAQTNDDIAWEKVDSTKKELKTAKGQKLVDCYNLLAECYFWIWDDDDKHFDTACMYKDKAYEEAKKIYYKKGIAYSKADLADRPLVKIDKDRNNNDKEIAYIQKYKRAEEALKLADELKDDYLSGIIYFHLAWTEKWWGSTEKFKANTKKAIQHIEKITGNEFKAGKPLYIINCAGCKGTEALLAYLHQDLANIYLQENNYVSAKEEIELAIHFYEVMGNVGNQLDHVNKNRLGALYNQLGQYYYTKFDYRNSIPALIKSSQVYHNAGNIEMELTQMNELNKVYEAGSDFENGISTFKNSIKLIEEYFKDRPAGSAKRASAGQAFFWMSRLYKIAGDYEAALAIMRRGRQYYPAGEDTTTKAPWLSEIGDAHRLLGNYDSAIYYLKSFQISNNNPNNFGKVSLGYLYVDLKEYSKADSLILPYYQNLKTINRITNPIVNSLNILGNASLGEKKYAQALQYAQEAQGYLKLMGVRILMIDNYKLLADIYDKMNMHDSAYVFLKQYARLKDSLINRQFFFRLNSLKNESEEQKKTSLIQLLQRDNMIKEQILQEELLKKKQTEAELVLFDQSNKIKDQELLIKEQNLKEQTLLKEKNQSQIGLLDNENKLKDQQLRQQATIKNALLAGLLLFLALGIFIFRSLSLRRKNERLLNEKQKIELQQKASELEMQALRAQMNPHFIFNCLSSINKFILKNDTDTASDYLTRFSRLIRQSLTNSQLSLIPLSDEVEMLRLYLDMERLRFSDSFTYNITYENSIEPETVYVPPMLLQPFCENAIWHGLMHKEGAGKLEVVLSLEKGQLRCIIADNGIGRAKAAELKTKFNGKQNSLGLKITTERLALFNDQRSTHDFYKTEDVLDSNGDIAGTKVVLNIKIKNPVHQPAKERV
jgi:tetratricopeptide (TPR) repeat protein